MLIIVPLFAYIWTKHMVKKWKLTKLGTGEEYEKFCGQKECQTERYVYFKINTHRSIFKNIPGKKIGLLISNRSTVYGELL